MNGERFNSKKAWGAAANGAVVGAVRGALVSSGVGLIGSLGANFGAGTIGSALEQKIGRGRVNIRESITNGLTNAVSGAIYGNNPLKGVGDAFRRGAAAGAATAAIQNLSNMWNSRNTVGSRSGRRGNGGSGGRVGGYTGGRRSPYTRSRNPRACGAPSSFRGGLGYTRAYGYQYQPSRSSRGRRENFSLEGFMKDVLLGAVMGGLSSAAFYGAGKGVEKLWGSLKGRSKGGTVSNQNLKYDLQFFADKGKRPQNLSPNGAGRRGAFREAKRSSGIPVTQHPNKVSPALNRSGKSIPGRDYHFNKKKIVNEHYGHTYFDDPTQNRRNHFNDIFGNHFDY